MLSSESEQSDVDMSPKKQSKKEDKKSVRPTSSKRKKSNEQESDEESADEEFHTPQQAKSATNFEIGQTVVLNYYYLTNNTKVFLSQVLALWPNDKYYYRGVIKSINLNSKKVVCYRSLLSTVYVMNVCNRIRESSSFNLMTTASQEQIIFETHLSP